MNSAAYAQTSDGRKRTCASLHSGISPQREQRSNGNFRTLNASRPICEAGHSFSRVSIYANTPETLIGANHDTQVAIRKKIDRTITAPAANSASAARAISASGGGTVTTTYTPEPKDKSTKIVFIQVMRELLDGAPVRPSALSPGIVYMDADTTDDFYHVDYFSGEKDPYYSGDDPNDVGTKGNATMTPKIPARTSDAPSMPDVFPAGKTRMRWEFRTAAFSAVGEDAGTYYGYSDWAYAKEKGRAATTALGATSSSEPGSEFKNAVKKWCSNHGFSLPGLGGNAFLGGLLGGVAGAGLGAAIGFGFGGPIGALAGGLIGLAAGATIGALAGRKGAR